MWPGQTNIQESLFPRIPTTLIDISKVSELKERAMSQFESQYLNERPGKETAPKLADFAALYWRVPEAEVFLASNPQFYDALPLSKFNLDLARMSFQEEIGLLKGI